MHTLIKNSDIQGKDPDYNAKTFLCKCWKALNKKFQHIVELNAGAALYVIWFNQESFKEGFKLAKDM